MVNPSAFCRSIKYDYINILTWTKLKKIQISNGCETFAFKYITWNSYNQKDVPLLDSQGSHRLVKYLNMQDCLEKSLKIKFALKST